MGDIELEEGEAYYLQNHGDLNIDPDKAFSYIDKKIENVLGHYQKDFMGGLTAESLGARFGGYGSFLPMQQRSPSVLSNQRSHISSKSPCNIPEEKSSVAANHSLEVRPKPASSDHSMQALSESGISSTNKKFKIQSSGECASNNQQNKLIMHQNNHKLLKFRVKVASGNIVSHNKSSIYSGLGLDMSPSSSRADSPSENDRNSHSVQEMIQESPSNIVEIMTSFCAPGNALLSPLHDSLFNLSGMDSNLESSDGQLLPVGTIQESTYSAGKREASKERKSRPKDPSMARKSKHKEPSKVRKLKGNVQSENPVESVKEIPGYNIVASCANIKEESGMLVAKEFVSKTSIAAVDVDPKEKNLAALRGKNTGFMPSIAVDDKSEVRCSKEDMGNSIKPVRVAKDKGKEEFGSESFNAAVVDEGNVNTLRGNIVKDKNSIPNLSKESTTDKRNEVGRRQADAVFKSVCSKEASVCTKDNGIDKVPKINEVNFVSMKNVEENDRHYDEGIKDRNFETLEPSKKKSHVKAIPHTQIGEGVPGGKEHSSSVAKKKSKQSQEEKEVVILRSDIQSKSKGGDIYFQKDMKKDSGMASNVNSEKKGKDVKSRDFMTGDCERGTLESISKLKESSKKTGLVSNIGSNMGRDLAGGNSVMQKVPVDDVLPPQNASVVIEEDWVQCEKCQKWRLLPFGTNPDFLPKEWICSMLNWLVSEDETTNGLRALYLAPVATSQLQNNQQVYPDGNASVIASAGARDVGFPGQATNVDNANSGREKKSLIKTETDAPRRSGFQESLIPNKDEHHSGVIRNSNNMKIFLREADSLVKNGHDKPSKIEKKRVADFEASRVPKKIKRVHEPSMGNPNLVRLLEVEGKGESQSYGPRIKGSAKSPRLKVKDRVQNSTTTKDKERKDVSTKKRKKEDQVPHPMNDLVGSGHSKEKNQRKSKASNFQAMESSEDKVNSRTHSDVGKHSLGGAGDNSLQKGGRTDDLLMEHHYADWESQKTTDSRKSFEKALDLGLSDNVTTSSSSKISRKVRVREVKCSPIGSTSSSPLKVSKSNPNKGTNKTCSSYGEREELISAKRPKARAEGECATYDEEMRDRKSNLSKKSDLGQSVQKISLGRRPSEHRVDAQLKPEDYQDASGKLDHVFHEKEELTSQQNLVSGNQVSRSSNRSHFDETNYKRGKLHDSLIRSEKELSFHSGSVPEFEKGSGSNAVRVGNHHVSLRHPHHIEQFFKDMEASSSMKNSFHRAAKTALREAKNLKHSADRLKISGSRLESTEVFFQAALKFLHGASLLDPGNNASDGFGEMSSTAVYSTTAKLCEYCAHEYERCNAMASAALAYKCMEVAYMRVVYSKDLAASRDRLELQVAARSAPQVESPSSSASDVDNLNNQSAIETWDGRSAMDHRNHVISAANRPNFLRLLNFTHDINLAMEASRRSQMAFAAANPILEQAGNEEGMSSIKRVLDFSFHDVDGLLHLVRLAMEALIN